MKVKESEMQMVTGFELEQYMAKYKWLGIHISRTLENAIRVTVTIDDNGKYYSSTCQQKEMTIDERIGYALEKTLLKIHQTTK